jgi:hypothetical protein
MKKFEDIRIEPADNGGCVLRYTKRSKSPDTKSEFANCSNYEYKTEVYSKDEMTNALAKMQMLVEDKEEE